MATESEADGFRADASLRWRRLKGRLFEGVLVGATLVGIVALALLFVLIGMDAFGPLSAEPSWFLVYFATLVGPLSAYTLYVRRRPAAAAVNARAFAVVFGSLVVSLIVYIVGMALRPHDIAIYLVMGGVPPIAVMGYARRFGETELTGPAIPVSILAGIAAGRLLYGPIDSVVGILADWIVFLVVVTVPVAAVLGWAVARRSSRRLGIGVAGLVLTAGVGGGAVGVTTGQFAALFTVLASGFVAPTLFVVVDTVRNRSEGRIGLLGPAIIVGGVLAGATVERTLGIAGLDSWLTPTLLLNSWSTFRPEQAGIYPQLVGSIVIIALMAVLSFPVGVGAAIYLEEYAPSTGWLGRVASVLDVNISNLAGVPSVVYGLLGLALFRNVFGLANGLVVAAGTTLGLLILPIVIVSSQEALRSVPDELRQGSYGLGASRWQTVRNVVLPEAVPGILTGTILALGRAIGETAPLVMIGVATTSFSPPSGLFAQTSALPLQIFAAKGNNIPAYRTGLVAATAVVLLVLMLVMNGIAIAVRNRYENN